MQKSAVSSSTIGHTAGSIFAILRWMAKSQAVETQYELLHIFPSFHQLVDLKFSQLQIPYCPFLNGHSEFFCFIDLSALDVEVLAFGFSRF